MGRILITRSSAQGQEFVNKHCLGAGFEISDFFFEPLIEIKKFGVITPDLEIYDGVIFTSVNACHVLPSDIVDIPVYCVGEVLAKKYKTSKAYATASELVQNILSDYPDGGRRFLYLRGEDVSFDIKAELEQAGHDVADAIAYKAVAAQEFSDEFIWAIRNNEISVITFFSERTAKIFVELAKSANIIDELKTIKVLCISDRMVGCTYSIFGENIELSATPDAYGMAQRLLCMVK